MPDQVARLRRGVGIQFDASLQTLQSFHAESLAHLPQQVVAAPLEAEYIALVQRPDLGLFRGRLTQDATHQLRQRASRAGIGEYREHIGECAVPALLQRLLGDDVANLAVASHQAADLVHRLQFIVLAGLDRNVFWVDSRMPQEVFAGIVRMNEARAPLIAPRALDLDDADWPDVVAALRFVLPRILFKPVSVFDGGEQRVLPINAGAVAYVQV